MSSFYDFAIVGCGIAGASIAYELSKEGAKVCVIEAEAYPAFHTTGRSAAFYMEGYGNDTVRAITQQSLSFFNSPPEGFNQKPILKDCGALYIANQQQEAKLQQCVDQLKKVIPDCQLVDQTFIQEKISAIRGSITSGYWEPHSKEIDVAELLQGYLKLSKQHQTQYFFNQTIETLSKKNHVWQINQSIQANTLINAGGAWADSISIQAGAQAVGLLPKKRNICVAKIKGKPSSVEKWPLCIDIDEQFYFKPEGQNLLITPADEIPSEAHDAQADEYQIALGIERVKSVVDIEVTHLQRQWAGLRTFASDRSPVVGYDPHQKDLFWIAGQGGYGIQMAPALAKLAAKLVLNPTLSNELLSPERFF